MKSFKAGTYIQRDAYKSFQPSFINREWKIDDMEIISLLSDADQALGRLDMYSNYVPNIDLFIGLHVAKEATQSTRIEGTQTNLEEALLDRDDIPVDKRDDWEEVQNYIRALDFAIESLDDFPLSSRLIRNTHRVLLEGVRGQHKLPGEFRKSQNWIGGASIRDAIFIPPEQSTVPELMGDLEKFIHNRDISLPSLIKAAIVHYQFETIHPFLDGNGRAGRLLITLLLIHEGILKRPVLYLSDFLERNRRLYYDNLMRVREQDDIAQWLKFFLAGVLETANSGIETFDQILQLQKDIDESIQSLGARAANANLVVQHLYQRPVVNAEKVAKITAQSLPTAYRLIEQLRNLGILKEITGAKRGKMYLFEKYVNLFRPKV